MMKLPIMLLFFVLSLSASAAVPVSVRANFEEINILMSFIDKKDLDSKFFFLAFKTTQLKNLRKEHLKAILDKMQKAKNDLYVLSLNVENIDSEDGKEVVKLAARFYGQIGRLHQIVASAAHVQEDTSFNYSVLQGLTMRLNKKVGLELLAKMNLKARHVDASTLEFSISEEEKQIFEYNVLQAPGTSTEYAKLIQFMSIRTFLTNKWAMERLLNFKIDDPQLNSCGPNMISFRPGSDKTMSASPISQDLRRYDDYSQRYVPLLDKIIAVSKKENLLSASTALNLAQAASSFLKDKMLNTYHWTEDEFEDWNKDIAQTIQKNEINEWENMAKTVLPVSVFPGDDLSPEGIEKRIVEDVYQTRKAAIVVQMMDLMEGLTPLEVANLKKSLHEDLDLMRPEWEKRLSLSLRPLLSSMKDDALFKGRNYLAKIKKMVDVAKDALSAAYISFYVHNNHLTDKMSWTKKLPLSDIEPKTPSELSDYFQTKLNESAAGYAVLQSMGQNPEYKKIVEDFFKTINNKFEAIDGKYGTLEKQKLLFAFAQGQAEKLLSAFPKVEVPRVVPAMKDGVLTPTDLQRYVPAVKDANSNFSWEKYQENKNKKVKASAPKLPKIEFPKSHQKVDQTFVSTRPVIEPKKEEASKEFLDKEAGKPLIKSKKDFVVNFLSLLNLQESTKTNRFLGSLGDQNIVAELRLAQAYSAEPVLRVPLVRVSQEADLVGPDGYVTQEVKDEQPALIRMGQTLSSTFKIDESALTSLAKETIEVAKNNLKNKIKVFCLADYKNPKDENYIQMFKSSTLIRTGLSAKGSLPDDVLARMKKFEEELKKQTRHFHEMINEDYIQPMWNVAGVIFIISGVVASVVSSAGLLTPGSLAVLMTMIDATDLTIAGLSTYYTSVSSFYEIPAQVRFQKSLAISQIDNFQLTNWDDVTVAQEEDRTQKILNSLFISMNGLSLRQFYKSSASLLGVTGAQGLKTLGLPARGFGEPPKSLVTSISLKDMIQDKGLVKGTIAKVNHDIKNLKYWTPRYQPLTEEQLTSALRNGLVIKSKELGIEGRPWELIKDIEKIKDSYQFRDEKMLGQAISKFFKHAKLTSETLGAIKRLDQRLAQKRSSLLNGMLEKLNEVEKLASTNPEILEQSHKSDWMDYFQSLLDDQELHVLKEVKKFKPVFKAYEDVMESIRPFPASVEDVIKNESPSLNDEDLLLILKKMGKNL